MTVSEIGCPVFYPDRAKCGVVEWVGFRNGMPIVRVRWRSGGTSLISPSKLEVDLDELK